MNSKLVSPITAAGLLAVSRRTIYRMMDSGELTSVNIRRARRIPIAAIEALTAAPELSNTATGTKSKARS